MWVLSTVHPEVSHSLSQLCSKDSRFQWDEKCELAFNKLKAHLVTAPILAYPDYAREFILDTDAGQVGSGAVLSQIHGGQERVMSYYPKMYSSEESKVYCVTRQELLAIIKAVRHFRPQLYGRRFLLRTDHASLVWLLQNPAATGQLARWLETLSEYNFRIQHMEGRKHNNADGLSRQICKECKQCDRMFPFSRQDQPFLDCSTKQRTKIPFYCYPNRHSVRNNDCTSCTIPYFPTKED